MLCHPSRLRLLPFVIPRASAAEARGICSFFSLVIPTGAAVSAAEWRDLFLPAVILSEGGLAAGVEGPLSPRRSCGAPRRFSAASRDPYRFVITSPPPSLFRLSSLAFPPSNVCRPSRLRRGDAGDLLFLRLASEPHVLSSQEEDPLKLHEGRAGHFP